MSIKIKFKQNGIKRLQVVLCLHSSFENNKKKEHLLFQEHEPQYRYISKGKIQPHAPYISQFQTNNNFILVFSTEMCPKLASLNIFIKFYLL